MNRGLLIFAFFLILVGYISGFVAVLVFGVLLLLPALLIPSSRPPTPAGQTGQTGQSQPRRSQPQPPPSAAMPQSQATQVVVVEPMASPRLVYSPDVGRSAALFPTPMFPSISPIVGQYVTAPPAPERGEKEKRAESSDELLELVALMALLKLVSS